MCAPLLGKRTSEALDDGFPWSGLLLEERRLRMSNDSLLGERTGKD